MQLLQGPTGLQAPQVHRTCRKAVLRSQTPVTHDSFCGRCATQLVALLQVKLGPLIFTPCLGVQVDMRRSAHWLWLEEAPNTDGAHG